MNPKIFSTKTARLGVGILLFLLGSTGIQAQTWLQVGADIDGEAAFDFSSNSVSLSSDGTTVAIGAPGNDGTGTSAGHVRVFKKNMSGSWVQLGADIDGEAAGDVSGWSVSLSSDGTKVAIGARLNNGTASSAGHVRVYQYNGSNWVQLGADIDGEAAGDASGTSVSLSSDGTTVAIGAPFNGIGTDEGHVRVYQYNGSSWVQVGADIDGETAFEESGSSVSLSSDGTTVAIGTYRRDLVRVYQYNGSSWVKLGANINGEELGDRTGYSVSLSSDGMTVAIGAPLNGIGTDEGHVRVYQYNGSSWVQVGADINGEAMDDVSGWSVSLSSDGTTVAIGASRNDGTGTDAGHLRVYQYNGSSWVQVGADIDGEAAFDESGFSVSLSSDGTTVAIGAPYNVGTGTNAGHVRVYGFPSCADADSDGYTGAACGGTDCNDANPAIHPGATETCNGVDDNCDSQTDEGGVCCPAGNIMYVNQNASGANTGQTWTDAFTDLQSALNSSCPGITQIWVAAGIYKPTTGTDPAISFVMKNGVGIYGGFNGTETLLSQRDWVTNLTTLSGDIGTQGANSDNSYHVVFNNNNGLTSTAILDGFTLTDGNSTTFPNYFGGGMYNEQASPTVANCTFSGNSAVHGGGMYNRIGSSPTLTNCSFSGNSASNAGGMYNILSSPILANCSFSGNSASGGGGMYNAFSSPSVTNCSFSGNSAIDGGGMFNNSSSSPTLTNCSFSGNLASNGGGMFNQSSSPILVNCSFSGNSGFSGGGMKNEFGSSPTLTNCILWGNGIEIYNYNINSNSNNPTVTYSIVQGGCPAGAACSNVLNADPLFVMQPPVGLGTSGDLHLQACSPAIDAGTATNAPATDIEGLSRVDAIFGGGAVDIGAYEYQSDLDTDNDGYAYCGGDCNDSNAAVNPGATEVCNGVDDDCDGTADDGLVFQNYYLDNDADGYGAGTAVNACQSPGANYVLQNGDCDNANAAVNPGATEVCNSLDDDCDGTADDGLVFQNYYLDGDADGYGAGTAVNACQSPGANYVLQNGDCDDSNAAVNPGTTEVCNGVDDDCDGTADDGLVFQNYYLDGDADGYGAGSAVNACQSPGANYVLQNGDCDDSNAAVNPGATEVCNGLDDDCNGTADDGLTFLDYYLDGDSDGYGAGSAVNACQSPGSNYVLQNGDCDDSNAAVNPGATEVCNGVDDDCDGPVDEGVQLTFYADTDGDGFGDAAASQMACTAPNGFVSNDDDCDDTDSSVKPGAIEACNGVDDDCDGLTDDDDPDVTGRPTWYVDADDDGYGYGSTAQTLLACTQPEGYSPVSTDCDDGNQNVNPGMVESCNNGIDDDCDGLTDEDCCTLEASLPACQTVYFGYAPAASATLTAQPVNGTGPYTYAWNNGATTQSITVSPSATTTYSVTIEDANGCDASTFSLVEVVDVHCGNNNNKVYICHNGNNTLCVSASAVPDHLSHGDQLGACGAPNPCGGSQALMVVLDFNAVLYEQAEKLQVDLSWITNTGEADDRYEVEKALDGADFQPIAAGASARNDAKTHLYRDLDREPQEGVWLYRLKVIRRDGSIGYSEMRQVEVVVPEDFTVFPNPASERVQVSLKSSAGKMADLQIVSSLGVVVAERHFQALPDEPVSLELDGLKDGFYWLNVQVEGRRSRAVKFVVAKL